VSAFAAPTVMEPVHAVAIAALCRGSMCAALGRVDEAAACYHWVIAAGEAGSLKRELHVYGYALYELGILFADGVKALARRDESAPPAAAAGAGSAAPAAAAATPPAIRTARHMHVHGGSNVLSSGLLTGLGNREMRDQVRVMLKRAKDLRDDYNWKVRLHLRVHLTVDELRTKPGKRQAAAAAGSWLGGGAGGSAADAAKLEDAMLAAAAAPIGSSAGGEGEDDDDEVLE